MFYLSCFIVKKKRFITFLFVLKISSNISLVEQLKKLSSKRQQIFYFILSPVFFFFKSEKEYNCIHLAYHHFNYNHLRAKQIPQPNTYPPYRWNITQRRGYVTDPYLRSVYFQKLGCQEAQVTDTIIPFTWRTLIQGCMVLHG